MAPLFVLLPALFLANVLAVPTSVRDDESTPNYRLPTIYETDNYDLSLTVPPEAFTSENTSYTGTVKIKFSFKEVADTITLHAHPEFIVIDNVNFDGQDIDDYSIDDVTQKLTVNISGITVTATTTYVLAIDFTGRLSTEDMYGFYRSSYVENNNTKYLATTQFEPTHARKAFPCFDEPNFKATFDVSITYPSDLVVLFNTAINKIDGPSADNFTTAVFEQTPKMPTYLIAFIVSEFTCSDGDPVDDITFQVCSRDEVADTRTWAAEVGSKVIAELNSFTNYKYTLSKMDQVAIPDFSAGAMENWGLVTYRETALLWDEEESSNRYQQRVATVVAHEFAHQWFGDLVTCNWWSEIFLNEGFATYFEYHTTDKIVDGWELDKQFLVEQVHTALDADASSTSSALQSDANSPAEISGRFDTISYNKGGSILRMVSHILGLEEFQKGLQNYLSVMQHSNAVPEDLWNALDGISNTSLPADTLVEVMENWVKSPGFPLLTVTSNGDNVTITQERFLLSGESNTTWYVPITYTTSEDEEKFESTLPQTWLTPTKDAVVELPENSTWIILNNQQTGFYRVNYDDTLWANIRTALKSESFDGITELNRAQIVDDLFNLARVGKVKYPVLFNTVQFLANDTSYYPWYAAFTGYDFLLMRVGQNALGTAISSTILGLMQNLYDSVPFDKLNETNQIYTHKQVLALTWACRLGNEDCIDEVNKIYKEYRNTDQRPDKNLRTVVYCNALRYSSDSSDWEYLWEAYLNATDLSTEQVTILTALGCTKNTELLKEYLTKTITDGSGIRSQDALSAYSAVYSGNPGGVAVAYDFLVENYQQIAEKYQSMNALGSLVKGIAGRFTTEAEKNKLSELINKEGLPESFKTAAEEALVTAESNLAWLKKFEQELLDYYDIHSGVGSIGASISFTIIVVFIGKLFIY